MYKRQRELFAYIDSLATLQAKDVQEKLEQVFDQEQSVLSVILPV